MKEVYGIIYKTTCLINGKIYIGQNTTGNNNYMGSGTLIRAAIKKYGKENFIREILKECYNQTELDEWEDLLIWEYNSRDKSIGYNIAKGSVFATGEANHSKLPEVRTKMSEAQKGNKHNLGKKHSEETRFKIGAAHKGKTVSKETRTKIRESNKGENHPMYGKKHPEETKAKMSKPVLQYDIKGNIISEYYGSREAERQTGIAHEYISRCCKGKRKSAGGYIWKYK